MDLATIINFSLLTLMTLIVVVLIRLRSLLAIVLSSSIYSLLSAGLFVTLDAVDVAFTEAAVGAGITTVLLLMAIAVTGREQAVSRHGRFLPMAVIVVTGAALIYGTLDMPPFGDPGAPIHTHVAPHYLTQSSEEIGIPNVVTSRPGKLSGLRYTGRSHRDIYRCGRCAAAAGQDHQEQARIMDTGAGLILREVCRLIIPAVLLFALYVQFHGEYGPGGGFQAGVIFAAAVILYALVHGRQKAQRILPSGIVRACIAAGVLLYSGVGVATMLMGGNFLDYNVLLHGHQHAQHLGIFLIELGVGITVAAVMITVFYVLDEFCE